LAGKKPSKVSDNLLFIPQLGYSKNGITIFVTTDIPLYQNLNRIEVASQKQFAIGINYRF